MNVSAPVSSAMNVVFFGIPLKARATAKNWALVVRDFNRTLASIYNQSNPNFRVLVGCHEIPDLLVPTDERLQFIQVDSSPPNLDKDPAAIFADKGLKLRRVADRFREMGGCWFVALDGDNLVSARLVDFVLSNPTTNGYLARSAYMLDEQSRAMAIIPHPNIFSLPFDQIGGCAVIRFDKKDFGAEGEYPKSRFARYVGAADYRQLWQMASEENRSLEVLPFPALVYVLNTGDNYSFVHGPSRQWRVEKLIPNLRTFGSTPDSEVAPEFALDHPLWGASTGPAIRGRHPGEANFRAGFIGCAGMKCGSTALWEYLKLHPQIGLARFKEMRFFNDDQNYSGDREYSGYHSNFPRKDEALIYGEVTPLYVYHPSAMQRIRAYNPECKILCIFRNPINRAYSHWCMEVREGREDKSFSQALALESARHRSGLRRPTSRNYDFSYLGCGYYTAQIRQIWNLFPPEQTMFIKTDDLHSKPQHTMNQICDFLGIDSMDVPNNLRARSGGYRTRPTDKERQLLLDAYELEIRKLERLLGWDCSSWLSTDPSS